jgi:hypothetical protein
MEGGFGDPMGDKAVLLCVYLSFCVEHKFVMKGRLRDFLVCSFVTHVAASIVLGAHMSSRSMHKINHIIQCHGLTACTTGSNIEAFGSQSSVHVLSDDQRSDPFPSTSPIPHSHHFPAPASRASGFRSSRMGRRW